MNNVFEYTVYLIPPAFVALSEMYRVKLKKLKNSGKIPDLIVAKQRHVAFVIMAVLSLAIIIMTV